MTLWRVIPSCIDPDADTVLCYSVDVAPSGEGFVYVHRSVPATVAFDARGAWSDRAVTEYLAEGRP